ncbi:glycoside hydrolase family 2 TIM barrel-domain containing protein [Nibrella viscosa]|uniref:glycoside hydrolase family 2 TIM barrel-domain containing protein n=1 Tax=Nibrella viscosa TaxID=1084524 RepID=UPI0031E91B2E
MTFKKTIFRQALLILLYVMGCQSQDRPVYRAGKQARTVTIQQDASGFSLYRNGQPYYIRGAGGYTYYDRLKAMGGNSIRVWDTSDADRILDQANEQGLTVMLGIWIVREKEGFNYFSQEAVAQLKERVRKEVLRYRNHPALLMWCIGNEIDFGLFNIKAWRVINEIAAIVHELDPNHPTTTTLIDVSPRVVRLLKEECPHIDLPSINSYRALPFFAENLQQSGWDGPYIVTEFGPPGAWESEKHTDWNIPVELTSSQKAEFIKERYTNDILGNASRCLGSYIFFWGQKQECTPTWFSLFTKSGEKTASADMMQYLWSGQWPVNRAPHLMSVRLQAADNTPANRLRPGQTYSAQVLVNDPEGDPLRYYWEVLPESDWRDLDGSVEKEVKPTPVDNVLITNNNAEIQLTGNLNPGPYRLFVYVYDDKGSVATANVPFLAEQVSEPRTR